MGRPQTLYKEVFGIDVDHVARHCKVSPGYVRLVLRGAVPPKNAKAAQVLSHLGLSQRILRAGRSRLAGANDKMTARLDAAERELIQKIKRNPQMGVLEVTGHPLYGRVLRRRYDARMWRLRQAAGILAPVDRRPRFLPRLPKSERKARLLNYLRRNPTVTAAELHGDLRGTLQLLYENRINDARRDAGIPIPMQKGSARRLEKEKAALEWLSKHPEATANEWQKRCPSLTIIEAAQAIGRIPRGWILASRRAAQEGISREWLRQLVIMNRIPHVRVSRHVFVPPAKEG